MRSALLIALFATALAGVVLGLSSCLSKPRFECASTGDCASSSGPGVCEPDGFCSFTDASCPSGRRYGDLSGPQANQCVGVPPDAPPPPDAAPDSYVHDARECFGDGAYQLCFTAMPPMGVVNLAGALDTTTDVRCQPTMPQSWTDSGQPDSCLIMGNSITVSAALTVTGTRPLVLLAETIAVNALLDLASHRAMASGPGAPASQCAAFGSTPVGDATGAAGGAGGSFTRKGGDGGRGNGGGVLGGIAAPDTVAPTVLRAGCAGQAGGAAGAVTAGAPGQGGGAVYLTASRILISGNGVISASGAGAVGGGSLTGGSGGGTGGMIVLHAAESIAATGGRLVANGGGGSGGAEVNVNGLPGADPVPATQSVPAPGGNGPGGNGGDGFAGTTAAQNGANAGGNKETGGGGGGGGGYIQSNRAVTGALVSPPVTVVP
ncbi:MAG: hypothetical protein H0T89_35815 [Deltaproteobacteria bacterium]|nr:hypothetical protein [Deltaproteobacteria bacterium]MDQ3298322.1 hypothetical protein [Myxococcota bacterium]